jgi:hypothetical protein
MHIPYEHWVVNRLRERVACAVEPPMRCIPLRNDPICLACYETANDTEEKDNNAKQKD